MKVGFIIIVYLLLLLIEYYILKKRFLQKEMFLASLLILTGLALSLILNINRTVTNPHVFIEKAFDKLFALFM